MSRIAMSAFVVIFAIPCFVRAELPGTLEVLANAAKGAREMPPVDAAEAMPTSAGTDAPSCMDAEDPACDSEYLALARESLEKLAAHDASLRRMSGLWSVARLQLKGTRKRDDAEIRALGDLQAMLDVADEVVAVEADLDRLLPRLVAVPTRRRIIPAGMRVELREGFVTYLQKDKPSARALLSDANVLVKGWPRGAQYDSPNIIGGMQGRFPGL